MVVVMEALIGVMRQFIHTIGPQQDSDDVLPSRRRFMRHLEARYVKRLSAKWSGT